jgi:putative DNA primase/helicase
MNIGITNFKQLQEKYPAVSITKISEPILNYYSKKGFKESEKRIWVDSIKDELVLTKIEEAENVEEEEEDYSRDSEEIRSEFIELISGKDKKWGKATELLANYVQQKLKLYTTKDDKQSEVWVYKEGVYIPNGKSEVKELLRGTLRDFYSSFVYNKVIEKVEPDTFISQSNFFSVNHKYEVPVENGILNIQTKEISPFDREKIFFNKLPVKYDPTASCPKIDEFLKNILKEKDDIKVFFELAGFSLLKEYRFEKAFMLVGDGRNGKGKSLELLKRLVGVDNCSSVPLVSLDPENFHISELFGKMLNLAGDIGNKDLKDTSMFKGLTGRDLINAHQSL